MKYSLGAEVNDRRIRTVAASIGIALMMVLAACGDPVPLTVPTDATAVPAPVSTTESVVIAPTEVPAPAATEVPAPAATEAPAPAGNADLVVTAISSDFGQILVDGDGFSLYGFTDDVDGVSVCEGGCADAWPPVLVPSVNVPSGIDTSVVDASLFSVVPRSDGSFQLKVGVWPLYYFAGDTEIGDTTGHLSGDVWFLVSDTGTLIDAPPAAAPVSTADSSLGQVLVNDDGFTLYGFIDDVDGVSVCEGGCADAWPPVLVPSADLPSGLDAATFSVVPRSDGSFQLKAGVWPLYTFAGDSAAGDTTGQLSGNVWFAVAPDGTLIGVPAEPAAEPTAVPATPVPATPVPATPVPAAPEPTPIPATPVPAVPAPTPGA